MLRIFLLFQKLKSKRPRRGCLSLKMVGEGTLSVEGSFATPTIPDRAATNEIDPYELSAARNSTH